MLIPKLLDDPLESGEPRFNPCTNRLRTEAGASVILLRIHPQTSIFVTEPALEMRSTVAPFVINIGAAKAVVERGVWFVQ
jgi:hypothetical protein